MCRVVTGKLKINRDIKQVIPVSYVIGHSSDALVDVSGALTHGVSCRRCKRLHMKSQVGDDQKTRYVSVIGSLMTNYDGVRVGNGNWDTYGIDVNHFCATCFVKEAAELTGLKIKFDGSNEE